jgi:uncharacterized protein (TIGR03435 family)
MGSLAFALMRQLGRSVVDKTGLTEKYDLILKWSPDEPAPPISNGPVNTQQGTAQSPDSSWPSIFTAIQEPAWFAIGTHDGTGRMRLH